MLLKCYWVTAMPSYFFKPLFEKVTVGDIYTVILMLEKVEDRHLFSSIFTCRWFSENGIFKKIEVVKQILKRNSCSLKI